MARQSATAGGGRAALQDLSRVRLACGFRVLTIHLGAGIRYVVRVRKHRGTVFRWRLSRHLCLLHVTALRWRKTHTQDDAGKRGQR
jgi:hypothetical protein